MTIGSLFSGIGGIDFGFLQAGNEVLWAVERDKACCRTYKHNFPKVRLIEKDIRPIILKDYCFSANQELHDAGIQLLTRNIGAKNIR